MDQNAHSPLADAPTAAPGESPQTAPPEPAAQAPSAAPELDPAAQRLHFLFRRVGGTNRTHVLKNALFEYRGIKLP